MTCLDAKGRSALLEANMYKKIDLDLWVLSDKMDLEEVDIHSFIKENNGIAFKEYLNDFRVEKLLEMLEKDILIERPGYYIKNSGFNSITTFERVFKKKTGTNLREYLKILKQTNKKYPTKK